MSTLQPVQGGPGRAGDTATWLSRPMATAVVAFLVMNVQRTDATHPEPVWRDRANFIIGAPLPEEGRAEQLWARQAGDRRFELCCIPFFLYDIALGDVVETDTEYNIERVVEPSGRYVFRVWFGDSYHPREPIAHKLGDAGALLEWSSANLLAVDAADKSLAQKIAGILAEEEKAGTLTFETGRS